MKLIAVWRQFLNLAVAGIAFCIVYFTNRHAREWGLEEESADPKLAFVFGLFAAILGFLGSWAYNRKKPSGTHKSAD